MGDAVKITFTSTLDLPAIERRLNEAELRILRVGGDRIVRKIKVRWVGWKYDSAPADKRGRSRAGWKRTLTSNTDPITLTIFNDAVDYYKSKPYVVFVKRKEGDQPEYEKVFADVIATDIPELSKELETAILAAVDTPSPPKRIRPNKAGATVKRTIS